MRKIDYLTFKSIYPTKKGSLLDYIENNNLLSQEKFFRPATIAITRYGWNIYTLNGFNRLIMGYFPVVIWEWLNNTPCSYSNWDYEKSIIQFETM